MSPNPKSLRPVAGCACGLALLALAGTIEGCRRQEKQAPKGDPVTRAAAQIASAQASARARRDAAPKARESQVSDEPPERLDTDAGAAADGEWVASELFDVGPAGPATATGSGIVMVTRSDELVLAPATSKSKKAPARPAALRFEQVRRDSEHFFPYAAGPAVVAEHAYWITKGRLVRQKLGSAGPPEGLATDARSGARVAAPAPPAAGGPAGPAAVAYIAQQGDALVAKLWVEGHGSRRLSPDGTAANSVALIRCPAGLVAVFLEGRSGMSPVHARRVTFRGTEPVLGDDVVAWVAGTSQQLTEVHGVGAGKDQAWAFLPIERDMTHYGLARIAISIPPRANADVSWRNYPNGLDPAPADCAELCGRPAVAYVRPSDRTPRAPQELHLARVEERGLGPSQVVARARAIANVSISAVPGGAVLAYVADRRTWALALSCPTTDAARKQ